MMYKIGRKIRVESIRTSDLFILYLTAFLIHYSYNSESKTWIEHQKRIGTYSECGLYTPKTYKTKQNKTNNVKNDVTKLVIELPKNSVKFWQICIPNKSLFCFLILCFLGCRLRI